MCCRHARSYSSEQEDSDSDQEVDVRVCQHHCQVCQAYGFRFLNDCVCNPQSPEGEFLKLGVRVSCIPFHNTLPVCFLVQVFIEGLLSFHLSLEAVRFVVPEARGLEV